MTTGAKTVDVELTQDELVALLEGVRPRLMNRLRAASRLERQKPLRSTCFCFTGTEREAFALLELATTRAPSAVLRVKQGLRVARAQARA
jgi:hypothetical protein